MIYHKKAAGNSISLQKGLNYLGQARIYSLVDLLLLLWAAGINDWRMCPTVLFWLGFLALLESKHQHENRAYIPPCVCWLLWMPALILLPYLTSLAFIILSYFYANKKWSFWGLCSPFVRGLQTICLITCAGSASSYWFVIIASVAITLRNLAGDWRDVEQDSREGLCTWPVLIGAKQGGLFIHLIAIIGTTWLWWSFTNLSYWIPILLNFIECGTYFLTPRPLKLLALNSKIYKLFPY